MTGKKKSPKKAGNVYKKLNIGFTRETYEKLYQLAEQEKRSLTGQILYILEREIEGKNEPYK